MIVLRLPFCHPASRLREALDSRGRAIARPRQQLVPRSLIFPDFLIRHRLDPRRQYLIEIVGFWSADYVTRKLDCLRIAGIKNLILAIDEERHCSDSDLPSGARVIRYRKRIDPLEVFGLLR